MSKLVDERQQSKRLHWRVRTDCSPHWRTRTSWTSATTFHAPATIWCSIEQSARLDHFLHSNALEILLGFQLCLHILISLQQSETTSKEPYFEMHHSRRSYLSRSKWRCFFCSSRPVWILFCSANNSCCLLNLNLLSFASKSCCRSECHFSNSQASKASAFSLILCASA